ncbi:hypothetical protein [Bradyrhizobium sp. LB11.1]|uniref:hypothetical protein n=1 Tax=Bradyrhizobium sp. LB11.1 TaxID=3156326 RepID=UPI003399D02E
MTLASVKKQLAALAVQIKPPHSLEARLNALTDEQRDFYWYWHQRYGDWLKRCLALDDDNEPDARPYARMLEHDTSPRLRRDVRIVLYGSDRLIPITADEIESARIYMDFCDEQR